ncbi:MAG: family 10 glycosylhydrolase [Crocinitomicaceae bacterium]|nr:family 10 glycosylhydrolase [Crocinitomicaceae bacterium]
MAQSNYEIDLTDKVVVPEHLIITKTSKKIKIDGRLDKAWENASSTKDFIDIEGEKDVKYRTSVRLLWDDQNLYVFAEIEEPQIWGDIKNRDEIIYYNNDFEVFLDPSGKGENYGEIEINALNTVWDLLLNKPYRAGGFANFHWNLDDLKTAVRIDGTLNDPSDEDQKWTVEMAIPLGPMIELKNDRRKPIKEGDQWRLNFSRVEWDYDIVDGKYQRKKVDGKYAREYNWVWSNQKAINMHAPEMWGVVQFTEKETSKGVDYIENPDLSIEQVLYSLYRERNWGELQSVKNLNDCSISISIKGQPKMLARYERTSFGYEIRVEDASTNQLFIINEQGEVQKKDIDNSFTFATWAHGGKTMDFDLWTKKLNDYQELGITEVLVGGSPEFLSDLVELASKKHIKIHAWMWTLNRPNDTIANKHPEWYAVNRNGQNSLEYRAYVDYYQWLSPFHPEAREHIKNNVRKLLEIEGLASIHLDYVRYVDVILGADLQPKYDLVQTTEMPEFDYGYHLIAREGFMTIFGKDPAEMEHPELSTEWRQYRLNAVTSLINEIADLVHKEGQSLTAAVFPFPEMSRQMVRQAWNDWDLDEAFPMIYHNFYRENINWIGFATEQGVKSVPFPINTGLYLPGFKSAEELESAIRIAKEKGATGVSFFTVDNMDEAYRQVVIKLSQELKQGN